MTPGNLVDMLFLYLKAFHLIAVVCWFAALFYLPRLFVYHAMSEDTPSRERFKVMERKLYRGIMTPSAIVTVALGFWMLHLNMDYYTTVWWIKLNWCAITQPVVISCASLLMIKTHAAIHSSGSSMSYLYYY